MSTADSVPPPVLLSATPADHSNLQLSSRCCIAKVYQLCAAVSPASSACDIPLTFVSASSTDHLTQHGIYSICPGTDSFWSSSGSETSDADSCLHYKLHTRLDNHDKQVATVSAFSVSFFEAEWQRVNGRMQCYSADKVQLVLLDQQGRVAASSASFACRHSNVAQVFQLDDVWWFHSNYRIGLRLVGRNETQAEDNLFYHAVQSFKLSGAVLPLHLKDCTPPGGGANHQTMQLSSVGQAFSRGAAADHAQLLFVMAPHQLVGVASDLSQRRINFKLVDSRHFRDMVFHQTEMARIIYNAADAAARFDHVFSLFLQEVSNRDAHFIDLARSTGAYHVLPRYFDLAAELLSSNPNDPDFGTNRALSRIGRNPAR